MKTEFLLFSLMVAFSTFQIQISPVSKCECSQIILFADCEQMPGCVWVQIFLECRIAKSCQTYYDQKQCLQQPNYCQWNSSSQICIPFQGCSSIYVSDYKQCGSSNLNCLAYDGNECQNIESKEFSTNCGDYPETYCTENVGHDGVCIWDGQQQNCQPFKSCQQATLESQCQLLNDANGYACQYIKGVCTQILNCSTFTTQDACRYYFPSLTSEYMILCEWIQSSQECQEAQNTLYLNADNCLKSTGYNYQWIPSYDFPWVGICAPCHQVQIPNYPLVTQSQCKCYQFHLQTECNPNYCIWNQYLKSCQDIQCAEVTSQSLCATINWCHWDFESIGRCQDFISCSKLPIKISGLACAAQSIQCPGFSDGVCQGVETLQDCFSYTTFIDYEEKCSNWFGKDGLCVSFQSLCFPLQDCGQLRTPSFCVEWENLCEWNYSDWICQQLTCSSYNNNPSKCQYVISGFQETRYELCKYNTALGICVNAGSGIQLNAQNCAANTASTYRWTQITPQKGICAQCESEKIYSINECSCFQFVTESDCLNSAYCTLSETNLCIQKPCYQIYNQITCASLNNCYWNSIQGCLNFTQCSDITANNLTECLAQNVSCKSFSSQTNTCSKYPQQSCSSYSLSECQNSIGLDGLCYINGNQCTSLSTCQGLSQTVCNKVLLACYWNSTQGNCQQMQCSQFTNKQQCKFYIEQPNSSSIIICQWNNNQCIIASDVMNQLTQQNCRINTGNTYRWIPTLNNGYCVKCQQQIILSNQCPCRYLYTQSNCYQSQECLWNYQQNICQSKQCNQILIKSICITSTQYCGWNQQTQQCINRQQINCNQLLGSTQQQCLQQSLNCPGTNGINCLSNLGSCQYYNTEQQCFESYGNDGVCMWDNFNQTCIGVLECSQLPQYLCSIKSYACYYYENKCQTLTCETLYLNTGLCTNIFSLHMPQLIQSCQLVAYNYECVTTNRFPLNEEQCFSHSQRTARWVPLNSNGSGFCEKCENNLNIINQSKCNCYQLLTQIDCLSPGTNCIWSEKYCQPYTINPPCVIQQQDICSQVSECYWNFTFNSCFYINTCNQLNGASSAQCIAQQTMCRGSNGTNCSEKPTNQCAYYSQQLCYGMIGIDGVCLYQEPTGCQGLSNCFQITNLYECDAFYKNACLVQNNKCQATQCQNYSTPATCTYVIASLLMWQIQMCQWDAILEQCINLISQKNKNFRNCGTSTAMTYRWVPLSYDNVTEGYCLSCQTPSNLFYASGQCACNQLFLSYECEQNLNCFWNGTGCFNVGCNFITTQYVCSTNPRCAWSESNEVCQSFTQCSDLAGVNAAECLSYSIHCGIATTTKLHNNKYACAMQTTSQCQGINSQECENTQVKGGVCVWRLNPPSCQKVTACNQLQTIQLCKLFMHTCYWSNSCNQIEYCFQINDCDYFFSEFSNLQSSIVYCQQNEYSSCEPINTKIASWLTEQNCYSNTFQMFRWSSSNSGNGYCVNCSLDIPIQSLCKCQQLTNSECQLYQQCQLSNNTCIDKTCNDYTLQEQCLQQNCIWIGGQCINFTDCSIIRNSNSPIDCITTSLKCPMFDSQFKTCNPLQKCNDQLIEYNCNQFNSQITIPYCYWNQQTQKCQTINNCGQINDIYECNLQYNRCQWSIINKCIPQQCNSFTSQTNCNYIYTSYIPGDIAICQWDSIMNICRNAPLNTITTFTNDTCSNNTGYNYHYDGNQCVRCQEVILFTLVILIQLLL